MEATQTGAVASGQSARDVVVFELGPISPLMNAARLAQDLAAASAVVTAVSCAAARAMAGAGGQLVAPARPPEGDREPVTDRLIAVCPKGKGDDIGKAAKEGARKKLEEIADSAKQRIE